MHRGTAWRAPQATGLHLGGLASSIRALATLEGLERLNLAPGSAATGKVAWSTHLQLEGSNPNKPSN